RPVREGPLDLHLPLHRRGRPRPPPSHARGGRGGGRVQRRDRRRGRRAAAALVSGARRHSARRATLAAVLVATALAPAVASTQSASTQAGGLTALPDAEAPGPNLLKNGDLEATSAWNLQPGGDVWVVERNGRDGKPALRMANKGQSYVPTAEQSVTLEP